MTKSTKQILRICAKPIPADIRWSELKTLLEHLGYKMLKNSGSRRKFFHQEKNLLIICHEPHPSPFVDKGCIADVADHLTTNGMI